jgi:hypothetical protein
MWPLAASSAESSHWVRSINEMLSTLELAVAALVLGPLVFAIILHCWDVTTVPETRNMRPPTDKEARMYTDILGQDIKVFCDWAAWMWSEIKAQVWCPTSNAHACRPKGDHARRLLPPGRPMARRPPPCACGPAALLLP